MKNVKENLRELIGNTPLFELKNIKKNFSLEGNLYAKLEYLNVTGSIKDKTALYMIEDAEEKGLLSRYSVIIEPTSGNTGIGLAAVGTSKHYKVIIVMPSTFSEERIRLMEAYGAEVVLSDGSKGMAGAIEKAKELAEQYEHSFIPDQFNNPANPRAHYMTTGPEIWESLEGNVDVLVASAGTGGTITGTARFLKERNTDISVIAVEPASSAVLSGEKPGPHKIQGIGAGFIPSVLDLSLVDEIIPVKNEDAFEMGALLGKKEGILCGISSGAALHAAIQVSRREEYRNKNVVVILPDSGDRYLSTELFNR